jgi:hypothetical protein
MRGDESLKTWNICSIPHEKVYIVQSCHGEQGKLTPLLHLTKSRKKDQDIYGWIILKWILQREGGVVWTGVIWLRSGTSGALL